MIRCRTPQPHARKQSHILTLIGIVFAAAACTNSDPEDAGATISDSAGVRIVVNHTPLLSPAQVWTIGERPQVRIGDDDNRGDAYILANPSGMVRFDNGTIAVGDRATIKFFDSSGQHIRSVGRRGQGPGEFEMVNKLTLGAMGNLIVSDGNRRVTFLSDTGEFIGLAQLPGMYSVDHQFPDGTLIGRSSGRAEGGSMGFSAMPDRTPDEQSFLESHYTTWTPEGGIISQFGSFPFYEMRGNHEAISSPRGSSDAWGDTFFRGYGAEYVVDAFNSAGKLTRSARRSATPVAVTPEHIEAYKTRYLATAASSGDPRIIELYTGFASDMRAVTHHPHFSAVKVDSEGYLWVRNYRVPEDSYSSSRRISTHESTQWSVFDHEGRWLMDVKAPEGVRIHQIGRDFILGVRMDDGEAPVVELYGLDRSGGGAAIIR